MKSWIVGAALAAAFAAPALADQCAWLDKDQTAKLQALIDSNFNGAAGLVEFCAPCSDAKAKGHRFGEKPDLKVVIKKEDDDNSSFSYDGNELDAAYTYIPSEKAPPFKAAQSLAMMVGCDVSDDTPKAIDVAGDGTVTPSK